MISHADSKARLSLTYKKEQVNITLEFPERSDQAAKQEFVGVLKEVYLSKIKKTTGQKEDLTL